MNCDFEGSVSTGTLLTKDLILNFMDALLNINTQEYKRLSRVEGNRAIELLDAVDSGLVILTKDGEEYLDYFLTDILWPIMEEQAPEGWYFGSLEGDGADFGYWRVEEEQADEQKEDSNE